MHDTPNEIHWHEPKAGENAGYGKFKRKALPYDLFMEEEGVPVYRGVGVKRVQDLPLAPWKRLGGRGATSSRTIAAACLEPAESARVWRWPSC